MDAVKNTPMKEPRRLGQRNGALAKSPSPAKTGKKAVKFAIEAPVAHEVAIAGSFNKWIPQPMKRGAKGIWRISVPLPPGPHEYRFVVDSEWMEDPASAERAATPFGGFNSVRVVP